MRGHEESFGDDQEGMRKERIVYLRTQGTADHVILLSEMEVEAAIQIRGSLRRIGEQQAGLIPEYMEGVPVFGDSEELEWLRQIADLTKCRPVEEKIRRRVGGWNGCRAGR